MRVLFLTNVPVPYRVDFFNELGKYCELEVLFEQSAEEQTHRSSNWFDKTFENFKASYLIDKNGKKRLDTVIPYLQDYRKDIIVVMGYSLPIEMFAISWLRFHRVPFFLSCDGGFIKYRHDPKRILKRFLVSSADGYLSTGNATDAFLTFYGAKPDRLFRIPLTTLYEKDILQRPVSFSEKASIRRELGIEEERVLLSVGQFIYRKGYDILLRAAEGLDDDIGIYIIGSEATAEYIQMKRELDLEHVHFVGFRKKDELSKYYKAADAFVLPTREDIWGLVINEALAYGLPVVTTDRCVAGLELVNDRNGRIVPADDAQALRNAIMSVINDRDLEHMGQESLKAIQNHTIENMAKTHFQVFFGQAESQRAAL